MTVQELALRGALQYSGITSLRNADNAPSAMARGKTAAIIDRCASAINAAMQKFARQAPHLFRVPDGGILLAPTSITGITATAGSRTISGFSQYTDAMRGCTIRIAGDPYDYEVVSDTEISREFCGVTASGLTAMVYFDAFPLRDEVGQVIEPVRIPGVGEMTLANSMSEFITGFPTNGGSPPMRVYGGSGDGIQNSTLDFKVLGRPCRYICTQRYYSNSAGPVQFMRVYPMPAVQYGMTFEVVIKPPAYTAADIDADADGADPQILIPQAWPESTLVALLRDEWMTDSTFFETDSKEQQISRKAAEGLDVAAARQPNVGYKEAIYR